jgi:hypothetical protein
MATAEYRAVRVERVALAASDAAGGVFAWQNLHENPVIVQRVDVYAMVVAEALLQWLPRRDHIDKVELDSIEFSSGRAELAGAENTIGEAQITFTVHVPLMVSTVAPFDPALAAGSPGGPPSTPAAPPVPWPTLGAGDVDATFDRLP